MEKDKSYILETILRRKAEKTIRRRKKQRDAKKVYSPNFKNEVTAPRKFRRYKQNNFLAHRVVKINKEYDLFKNELIRKHLPVNLKYIFGLNDSPFNLKNIQSKKYTSNGIIEIPDNFTIIDNPEPSYLTLQKVISALFIEYNRHVILDYKKCTKIGLGTQILLDIILIDFWKFREHCRNLHKNKVDFFPTLTGAQNINNEDIRKILFSVGSPANLNIREQNFPDIEKYKLCVHDNEKEKDKIKRMNQKELDTSDMADYVIKCLSRIGKKLTPEKLDDLCTIIGEILINAEEHSTTKYRFSIGYFKEEVNSDEHSGIFRLIILNFGKTIYEKFKDPECPNKDIVTKMEELSKSYTKRNLLFQRKFEEESLWTLYALQEGVTSVSATDYKRGNGSIRFIESFFNLKDNKEVDDISKMHIMSGKTCIVFDGTYEIKTKTNSDNEEFKVMTFNDTSNIEDKPNNDFVYSTDYYFPGTLISAKILLNEDDVKQININ